MAKGKTGKAKTRKAEKAEVKSAQRAPAKAKAKAAKAPGAAGKAASAKAPPAKAAPKVSPLAPGAFPQLPPIAGVRFSAVEAGVRYPGRLDVMLTEIAAGSTIAGVFTRSATRAAPVLWCEACLRAHGARGGSNAGFAILVNSGNANAFTGRNGVKAVETKAKAVGKTLGIPPEHVFVASTGVIGEALDARRITAKMKALGQGLNAAGGAEAARAIMTTDTFPKGAMATVTLDGVEVSIAGFAKGSGMIAPDMATLLGFVFTDAPISQRVLQSILVRECDASFNSITVDGDTSTSDTLIAAATGRAEMPPIRSFRDARVQAFQDAFGAVLRDLAHQIVRDGEGATKFVAVQVSGAASDKAARKVGFAIANSPLVKTAIAGEDPNWGRIVMAVGKSGERADRDRLAIRFGDLVVAEKGRVSPSYSEAAAAAYMKGAELEVGVDLGLGSGSAVVWTCDLTHRYIEINADYRS